MPRFSEDPKENFSYATNQLEIIFSPGTSKTRRYPTMKSLRSFDIIRRRRTSVRSSHLRNSCSRRTMFLPALILTAIVCAWAITQAQAQGEGRMTGLTVSSDAPGTVTIRWDAVDPKPKDYRVDWARTLEYYKGWDTDLYNVDFYHLYPDGNSTSLTISYMEVGIEHKMRMRSRHQGWSGPWAEIKSITPRAQSATDGVISGMSLTRNDSDLTIAWDPPPQPSLQPPTDYQISWTEDGGDYDTTRNAYQTGTFHDVGGLTSGTQYEVRVRPRYTDGHHSRYPWYGPWVQARTTTSGFEDLGRVTVTGLGTVSLSYGDPWAGVTLIAGLDDPNGIGEPTWEWERSRNGADDWVTAAGTVIHGGNGTTSYLPTANDVGYYLRATASYGNFHGEHTANAVTTAAVVAKPDCDSPTPVSHADFSWDHSPKDVWSDGRTLWVALENAGNPVRPFGLCTGARLPGDRYVDGALNSMWGQGPTMWVSYGVQGDLSLMKAYSMHPKGWIYDDSRVYRLEACSNGFYGLWSNGSILWAAGVSGRGVQPVFAFDWANRPAKGPRIVHSSNYEFTTSDWGNEANPYESPQGLATDASHMWLAQHSYPLGEPQPNPQILKALRIPSSPGPLVRDSARDINMGSELGIVGGLWTDGEWIWVASRDFFDRTKNKVSVFEIPQVSSMQAESSSPATGAPTIGGVPTVGQTLEADTIGIEDEDGLTGAVFAYQWVRHDRETRTDADIEGAASSTYTVTDADEGKTIKVRGTFTDDAGNDESLTSAPTATVAASNTPATGEPTITGTAQVGETLTADTTGISDSDGLNNAIFTYRWLADDADITDATGSTYALVAADEGRTIKVRGTFTDDAGNDESLTSAPTATVAASNTPATGEPTITGTAQVGETLTADTTGISDSDGLINATFTYQWIANDGTEDTDIQDATGSTYTVGADDEDKTIKVRVSFTDDGGTQERRTSDVTVAVAAAPSPTPLTAAIHDKPESHDGQDAFKFELRFSEELGTGFSYQTLRDHAFTVKGGTVAGARRLDSDSDTPNIRWEISVSSDSSADVTVELPATEDCDAQGAICTADGTMLSIPLKFTVKGPPLTASFESVPTSHNGSDNFKFRITFSEELEANFSYKTLRDHAFTVEGGTMDGARRLVSGSNIRWEVSVRPGSNGDVTITLPATTDCNAQGAICADGDKKLSNRLERTVSGPGQ